MIEYRMINNGTKLLNCSSLINCDTRSNHTITNLPTGFSIKVPSSLSALSLFVFGEHYAKCTAENIVNYSIPIIYVQPERRKTRLYTESAHNGYIAKEDWLNSKKKYIRKKKSTKEPNDKIETSRKSLNRRPGSNDELRK